VPGSTTFDHCAASTDYKSGITLGFVLMSDFSWVINLFDPNWSLTVGNSYPVTLAIDTRTLSPASAIAIDTDVIQIPLASNKATFKDFMGGNLLKVEAATQNYGFDLTDTSELLPALFKCVESYRGSAPPSSNPFAAPGGN
jgi:hypothetical protein